MREVVETVPRSVDVAGPEAVAPGAVGCAVVVVAYRNDGGIRALLRSLPAAMSGTTCHVTVVDNAGDCAVSQADAGGIPLALVRPGGNIGYAAAINAGARQLPDSDAVLVLNPDVELAEGSVVELLRALRAPDVGAVVPRLVDPTGTTSWSLRREPTVLRALGEAVLGDHLPGRPSVLSEMVRAPDVYAQPGPVDWATGAVLLARRAAFDLVGDWDPRFFLYSEETDWCRRLRATGAQVLFVPTAVAVHVGGGSGASAELVALSAVNRVRYAAKWHGPVVALVARAVAVLHSVLRITRPAERRSLQVLLTPGAVGRTITALSGGAA